MKRARRMGLHPRHDLSNPTRRCVEATIRQRSGKAYRESRPPPLRRPVTPPGDRIRAKLLGTATRPLS